MDFEPSLLFGWRGGALSFAEKELGEPSEGTSVGGRGARCVDYFSFLKNH